MVNNKGRPIVLKEIIKLYSVTTMTSSSISALKKKKVKGNVHSAITFFSIFLLITNRLLIKQIFLPPNVNSFIFSIIEQVLVEYLLCVKYYLDTRNKSFPFLVLMEFTV